MDKILALFLSFVPNAHVQVVQNDAQGHVRNVAVGQVIGCDKDALQASLEASGLYTKDEKGRYVLDVTKINDEYSYVLKDKQDGKETKFDVESEINSNVQTDYFGVQEKIRGIQDKASFNEAIEMMKDM